MSLYPLPYGAPYRFRTGDWACVPRDLNPHVSEDQGLPIGHGGVIALIRSLLLVAPGDGGSS
jgi:hypothetical protein